MGAVPARPAGRAGGRSARGTRRAPHRRIRAPRSRGTGARERSSARRGCAGSPRRRRPRPARTRSRQRRHVGVGPEVARPGDRDPPHYEHAWERLAQRHRDARVALVVGEADVEAGLVLLDEVVLEQQRLSLVGDDDRLKVGDLAHQRGVLGARVRVGAEVARHARSQALRLADIEDLARGALPEIHAGLVGEGFELAADQVTSFHRRAASGCFRANASAAYTTPKIVTPRRATGIGPVPVAKRTAAAAPVAAAPAATTLTPTARHSAAPRIAPIRRSRSRRWRMTLTVEPSDDPKAIPAGP